MGEVIVTSVDPIRSIAEVNSLSDESGNAIACERLMTPLGSIVTEMPKPVLIEIDSTPILPSVGLYEASKTRNAVMSLFRLPNVLFDTWRISGHSQPRPAASSTPSQMRSHVSGTDGTVIVVPCQVS